MTMAFAGHSPRLAGDRRIVSVGRIAWTRLCGTRRLLPTVTSRFTDRRFVFAFLFVAVLVSKIIHIKTNISALARLSFDRWAFSFFAQDIFLLIFLRLILEVWSPCTRCKTNPLHVAAAALSALLVLFVALICVIYTTFFVLSGGEIHWRNISLAGDAAGRALLLSGLASLVLVLSLLCLVALALHNFPFIVAGIFADLVTLPLVFATRGRLRRVQLQSSHSYVEIPQQKLWDDEGDGPDEEELRRPWSWRRMLKLALYAGAMAVMLAQIILCAMRPRQGVLQFLSRTPAILPLVELWSSSASIVNLGSFSDDARAHNLSSMTAIGPVTPFSWLPQQPVAGFEDWYDIDASHYNATADPLKISNLDLELLPEIRDHLQNVSIRHVMLIILESTRKDVFPLKRSGRMTKRLSDSWGHRGIPTAALKRLESLTPVAEHITGDFNDSFHQPLNTTARRPRGGISFNDAYTTSTYTLKSITGLLCGITPLLADFNTEYQHHIYQPCLPHIFAAFNELQNGTDDEMLAQRWKSGFMQTATFDFDNSSPLMRKIGFAENALVGKEYLQGKSAKFGRVSLPDVNYFGFEETPLKDYIRDMFSRARDSNERVFLTHLTSTSHHPWAMPGSEKHVDLVKGFDDLSHYLNTIGWDDRWLGEILQVLNQERVANETLVVFVGDHGLSMAEDDRVATYDDPNTSSNHVPLVLSHPGIPPVTIQSPVSSIQVLPTILDLLIETGSLSSPTRQAARELARNYEGQSLIRQVLTSSDATTPDGAQGHVKIEGNWHFTVINPGRAMVGVRDARQKTWRLVVPTQGDTKWRFSDLARDPAEANALTGFDFDRFVERVKGEYGTTAAEWVVEAGIVTRWWVEENSKRWRFLDF